MDNWFTSAKDRIENNTKLKSFSPGSITREMLAAYNDIASELSVTFDLKILNALVGTAVGENLDKLGKIVGKDRKSLSYALGSVKVSIDSLLGQTLDDLKDMVYAATGTRPDSIIIPAGTEVSNDNGNIIYNTTTDLVLSDTDVYVDALSILQGKSGNIPSGVLNKFSTFPTSLSSIASYILVTNPNPIDTGDDEESDDNYRYRIINAFTGSVAANEMALRLAALSVPGISDVLMKQYAYGIGTTGLFIISESPIVSQGLINAVYQAVNTVKADGNKVIVSAPTYKALNMTIVLEFVTGISASVKDTLTVQVVDNIIAYINNLKVNEEFVIHRLEQVILDTSYQIYDYSIEKIGIGDYNFETGLIDYYSPVLPVNQPVGDMEKWVTNSKLVEVCY